MQSAQEPLVHVGILSAPSLHFRLQGSYHTMHIPRQETGKDLHETKKSLPEATHEASLSCEYIVWQGHSYRELLFLPRHPQEDFFELYGVTIGIHFHWERQENQRFRGALKIIVQGNRLTAINILLVEDYLLSVISSEMSASASIHLLRAHAVISRSWLLAQIEHRREKQNTPTTTASATKPPTENPSSDPLIRWYDHEDHALFDVCADDHCQRYQGISRITSPQVARAIRSTRGEVLCHEGQLCDARFSKCCGGALEQFSTCWDNHEEPYLVGKRDLPDSPHPLPDLTTEAAARRWILSRPEACCRVEDPAILAQVLNGYDCETPDFYRWTVRYTQAALSALVARKLGIDFGLIQDLIPLRRGTSGRIILLRIVGTLRSLTIGKELLIRRTLSESHLYSSAFVIDRQGSDFVLHGAGWGHGVGLCQIGAAAMGAQGIDYRRILLHYYPGSDILRLPYAAE